jgi:hypothetical protein
MNEATHSRACVKESTTQPNTGIKNTEAKLIGLN